MSFTVHNGGAEGVTGGGIRFHPAARHFLIIAILAAW